MEQPHDHKCQKCGKEGNCVLIGTLPIRTLTDSGAVIIYGCHPDDKWICLACSSKKEDQ